MSKYIILHPEKASRKGLLDTSACDPNLHQSSESEISSIGTDCMTGKKRIRNLGYDTGNLSDNTVLYNAEMDGGV
jgi:hypothetical protein